MKLARDGWLRAILIACILAVFYAQSAAASDLTARQVTVRLFEAPAGERVDFNDLNLTLIDISGLDFKKAVFVGGIFTGPIFRDRTFQERISVTRALTVRRFSTRIFQGPT